MNIFPLKPVNIIVAMTRERLIGSGSNLPWHLPEDLKVFRQITMGNTLLMGRKTFESIGRPLPGRVSLVISSTAPAPPLPAIAAAPAPSTPSAPPAAPPAPSTPSAEYCPGQAYFFPDLFDAMGAAASQPGKLFVIGGASIYQQALPYADYIYLSLLRENYKGDVYFPDFDMDEWELAERSDYAAFELQTLKRRA